MPHVCAGQNAPYWTLHGAWAKISDYDGPEEAKTEALIEKLTFCYPYWSSLRNMKRDLDLIRKLLFFFEEKETAEHVEVPPIPGYDERIIKYHLVLLHDAGLLRCEPMRSSTSDRVIYVVPFELTWEGHEFLDKVRHDKVWERIRQIVAAKGGALAFGIVNQLATRLAMEMITET